MSTNHAKGWRRIGIALSVIWFVGYGGYMWFWSTGHNADFYGSQLRMCYAILDVDNETLQYTRTDEERGKKAVENQAKFEKCRSDAEKLFLSAAGQMYRGIPILLGIDLMTVGIGWLLAWFAVLLVRWVRRGFASA
jgi:hypothetical protein